MARLKIFIGSSSHARDVAEWVRKIIEDTGGVEAKGWWEWFRAGGTNIQTLQKVRSWADASLFIFSEDDHLTQRGDAAWAPRDNVVFEYGMFVAAQGMENAVLAKLGNPAIPTDLGGVIHIGLTKAHDKKSFVAVNRRAVGDWVREVKRTHGVYPTVAPVALIKNEHLRAFGATIVGAAAAAINELIHLAYIPRSEPKYWRELIDQEISGLKPGDSLWAICGAKNYNFSEVYRYLNENIALARRGVHVQRLYVAPNGKFKKREWEVIEAHLEWAGRLRDNFKVGVLLGKRACSQLLELNLPRRFGMVVTRRGDSWKAHIHYPDYPHNDRQVGWVFDDEAIVFKLRALFREIAWKAEQQGITPAVMNGIRRNIRVRGYVREKNLWRCSDKRRRI